MSVKVSNEVLKKYAKMSIDAFVDDPAYIISIKNEKLRKLVIYHGVLIRMYASRNLGFDFYFDEEERGMLVVRHAHTEYKVSDFLKCPNALAFIMLLPWAMKLMDIGDRCDNKQFFDDKTYIISPVFVDVNHQGKGVAKKLIERAVSDLRAKGYKLGLDTQNPDNLVKYEKMGFRQINHIFYDDIQMHNYHMILE